MTTKEMANMANNIADKVNTNSQDTIDDAMQAVEAAMYNVINSDVTVLREASQHILSAGGKRIRPRLTMLSYMATGGTDLQWAAPVAAAVELVHTASVVHDDINDHGVMRRGRASVNSIWGRTFALLTGDFLFTTVYELMAPYGDMNRVMAEATTALVEGETLQASAVKENNLSREIYMDIIGRKTAALFRSGAMLGALLNDESDEIVEALGQFGYNIGLAFQIVDDILDLIGDEATLGKTSGIDVGQGKGFASVQNGNSSNGHSHNGNGSNGNGNHQNGDDPMDIIREKVLSGNRIEEAREQSRMLVQMGIRALDVLPDSPYKDEMIRLAHSVVDRKF